MNWLLFPPFVKEQTSSERHSNLPNVIQQASTTTCLNQGLDSSPFSKFMLSTTESLSHLWWLFYLVLNYGYYLSYLVS